MVFQLFVYTLLQTDAHTGTNTEYMYNLNTAIWKLWSIILSNAKSDDWYCLYLVQTLITFRNIEYNKLSRQQPGYV